MEPPGGDKGQGERDERFLFPFPSSCKSPFCKRYSLLTPPPTLGQDYARVCYLLLVVRIAQSTTNNLCSGGYPSRGGKEELTAAFGKNNYFRPSPDATRLV